MKVFRIIVISLATIFIVFVFGVEVILWFGFYDVSGLKFYDDEPISDIVYASDTYYIITDDGGFMLGDYDYCQDHRKYSNVETHVKHDDFDKLGCGYKAVRFYDGKIRKMIFYDTSHKSAMFINDKDQLYELDCYEATKICDGVKDAYKDRESGIYFVIDSSDKLYSVDQSGNMNHLFDNVKTAKICFGSLYVLFYDGILYEYPNFIENGDTANKKLIYENVAEFDSLQINYRCGDKTCDICGPDFHKDALLNVLTVDESLLVKGTYDQYPGRSISNDVAPKSHNEWTLIGEDVVEFSTSEVGTVMRHKDQKCTYYGFNTNIEKSKGVFKKITLPIDNATKVYCDGITVIVGTQDRFYIWSGSWEIIFGKYRDDYSAPQTSSMFMTPHNIFDEDPMVVNK